MLSLPIVRGAMRRPHAPHTPSLATVVGIALALVCPTSAQDVAAEVTAIDARLTVPVGVPLLVKRDMKVEIDLAVRVLAIRRKGKLATNSQAEFIDEYSASADKTEDATRTFLKAWDKTNGEITDPPLAGVTVHCVRDDKTRINLVGPRSLPTSTLKDLLRAFDSLWIWARFPERVVLGQEFTLDLKPIAPVVFGWELVFDSASAQLSLAAWDPEKSVASFRGDIEVRATTPNESGAGSMILTFRGPIEMRTNLEQDRIEEIKLNGELSVTSPPKQVARFSGSGSFRGKLTTVIAKNAARLRKAKPRFRTAVRRAEALGLQLSLPSCWAPVEAEDQAYQLVRTVDRDLGGAHIGLQTIKDSNSEPRDYLSRLEENFKKSYPKTKAKKVSCKLGPGRAFTIPRKDGERDVFVLSEFYPYKRGWLIYKLSGDEKACKKALAEFRKARSSLRVAKPLF